jgi:hypothetical protein
MKITKRQLRRIIKEEKARFVEAGASGRGLPPDDRHDLYVNLDNNQLQALDDLVIAINHCRRIGVPEADLVDTIKSEVGLIRENIADGHEGTSLEHMPDAWRQVLKSCLKDKK